MLVKVMASNRPVRSSLLTALRYEGLRPQAQTISRLPMMLNDSFSPFGAVAIKAHGVDTSVLDGVRSALDGMRAMACQLLTTPVLVVVNSASARDWCAALDAGADDVVIGPQSDRDMQARVQAIHDRIRSRRVA